MCPCEVCLILGPLSAQLWQKDSPVLRVGSPPLPPPHRAGALQRWEVQTPSLSTVARVESSRAWLTFQAAGDPLDGEMAAAQGEFIFSAPNAREGVKWLPHGERGSASGGHWCFWKEQSLLQSTLGQRGRVLVPGHWGLLPYLSNCNPKENLVSDRVREAL